MASPAHPPDSNLYPNHITWVTRLRAPHFVDQALGLACLDAIESERKRLGLTVFAYALLPDHFHIIIGPTIIRVGFVVKCLKLASVHKLMAQGLTGGGLWQRQYYEVGLRDPQQVRNAIEYIHNNPSEAGLVADPVTYRLSSLGAWMDETPPRIHIARDELSFV